MYKSMTPAAALPVIFIFLVLLASCGKSNNGGEQEQYYIRCKIDGTARVFSGNSLAGLTDNTTAGSSGYSAVLVALKTAGNGSYNSFGIVLNSRAPFAVNGVYTQDFLSGSYDAGASLDYTDETGKVFASYNTVLAPDVHVSVRLTGLDGQSIRGTFSGTLYSSDLDYGHAVTEGEFNVKRN